MKIQYFFSVRKVFVMILFLISHSAFALEATYYADSFEWGKTARGDTFSQEYHSAAICEQNLWTYAYVTKWLTGAVVTLNDRPNCSRHSDVIDLSRSVFEAFAPTSVWRMTDVSVTPIWKNESNLPKKTFRLTAFSDLGVVLSKYISNTYFIGESILLEWRVLDKKEYVMIYVQSQADKTDYSQLVKLDSNGKFKFAFTLPKTPGKYFFVLASGNSFETTTPESIVLIDPASLIYPVITTGSTLIKPYLVTDQSSYIPLPENTWGSLMLTQGKKKFRTSWTVLIPLAQWMKIWKAQWSIEARSLSTPSSLDQSAQYGEVWSGSIILDRTRDITWKSKVNIRTKKWSFVFQFRVWLGDRIRSTYYVTLPSGEVREYKFAKKWLSEEWYLLEWANITATFGAHESWTYRLETVLENGYAYFNIPVYQGEVWSIVPLFTIKERITLEENVPLVQEYTLNKINSLRESLGRKSLTLDTDLTRIAMEKANNMANNNYIGHWTPEGMDILAFAKSIGLPTPNTLAENVAGWNVSYRVLQDWLEESGSHRHSMINPSWWKVWVWYVLKNKKAYFVQVFSE